MKIRIGTRKSELARIQAELVGVALASLSKGYKLEYHLQQSEGDKDRNTPLWKLPDKGVFTRDLSELLLKGEIDLAVHSWKDLPLLEGQDTAVIGTLPRADMRDLLLIRKDCWPKILSSSSIRILSSSPRRMFNIKDFLLWALPAEIKTVDFASVRGNIQTRLRKLFESDSDGIVVAKAGIDRLLGAEDPEYEKVRQEVQSAISACYWTVVPLSVNPGAPAQGALAIEALKTRADLVEIVSHINCKETFSCVQHEREVLRCYGGGCHQKIGMSVLERPFGRLSILRGETNEGLRLEELKLESKKPKAPKCVQGSYWPSDDEEGSFFEAVPLESLSQPNEDAALWVSKSSALPTHWRISFDTICWTAGLDTWKKLSKRGIWVHGSSESLGEKEPRLLEQLVSPHKSWVKLSHKNAPTSDGMLLCPTYELSPKSEMPKLQGKTHFYWRSSSAFSEALKHYPQIASAWHACGPGNTYEGIKKLLGNDERLSIYLSYEAWQRDIMECSP
ncbi:MAG: hydroxymethylbilane synthase [SAR324 cluster bacterium]|uniref:Hydroxymethylbilane synthase n=1 Tax=SAR324 cluster bacterium TaxID=2024889 RepID=A0A7X9FS27_9DELT|nr:hydroxymethylbilane synthase [SAR324 cluster bacterium]